MTRLHLPLVFLTVLLAALILAACATPPTQAPVPSGTPAAGQPTLPPASPTQPPPPTQPSGYPASGETPMSPYPAGGEALTVVPPGYPYPAVPPPSGAPAVDNRSKVTARFIEKLDAPDSPGFTRLHAQVLSSEDIPGMPSFTQGLVNQETDLYTDAASLPALNPGDTFSAEVVYRADERGGRYFAEKIQLVKP